MRHDALVAFDVGGHLVFPCLSRFRFHFERSSSTGGGSFIGLHSLAVAEGVRAKVVDAQIKDWRSMVCEAPAGVSERGCKYRADAALCSDQDMVNMTNALEFPGECALGFSFSLRPKGYTG